MSFISQFLSFISHLPGFSIDPRLLHYLHSLVWRLDDLLSLQTHSGNPPVLRVPGGVFHSVPGSLVAVRLSGSSPHEY